MSNHSGSGAPIKESMSPVLHRIVNGSSSTSLNLIPRRPPSAGAEEPTLFRSRAMGRTIIFKFPNFASSSGDSSRHSITNTNKRPIGTGIYIPNDTQYPMAGGYAIYLRSKNYQKLLLEYFGVEDGNQNASNDIVILELLDQVPSLDPFLLRVRLKLAGASIPPGLIEFSAAEHADVRQIVEIRIMPLLKRAMLGGALPSGRIESIIGSVWDPSVPEVAQLIEAFGVSSSECADVAFSLRGIAFYENQFLTSLDKSKSVLDWITKEIASPFDASRHSREELGELSKLRAEIVTSMTRTARSASHVFDTFESSINSFVVSGSPQMFVSFIKTANQHFWRLGHAVTALLNCHTIVSEEQSSGRLARSVARIQRTLGRLRVALSDTADKHRL